MSESTPVTPDQMMKCPICGVLIDKDNTGFHQCLYKNVQAHRTSNHQGPDGFTLDGIIANAERSGFIAAAEVSATLAALKELRDRRTVETGADNLGDQIYALLVRRGYAQHEAHLIAGGPGCISDCVQKGYPDIDCPKHGSSAVKASGDPPARDEGETPDEYRKRLDLLGYGVNGKSDSGKP